MLPKERRNQIEEIIVIEGSATVKALALQFEVTMETIRNDLDHLCKKDPNIIRVHGGAYRVQNAERVIPMMLRESIMIEEKLRLADAAVNLFHHGSSIILDTSSTAVHVAQKLIERKLQVAIITNSLPIINLLSSQEQIKIISLGGNYNRVFKSFTGPTTIDSLSNYHADYSIISPTKLSMDTGLSDDNQDIATIRKAMSIQCERCVLLVDHTKFDGSELFNISDFSHINQIISDAPPRSEWNEFLKIRNIKLTIV